MKNTFLKKSERAKDLWLPPEIHLLFYQMSFHQLTINPLIEKRYQNYDLLFPVGYSGNRRELPLLDHSTPYIRFLRSCWFPQQWLSSKHPVELQHTISLFDSKVHQCRFSLVFSSVALRFANPKSCMNPGIFTGWIVTVETLNGIKLRVFFGEDIEKKRLCHHDNNYCYFWTANTPVINLIVDSRNITTVSKNMSL